MKPWYRQEVEAALASLESDRDRGLDDKAVAQRRQRHGSNDHAYRVYRCCRRGR